MLTIDDYNAFCQSLPATHYVVQWGGSHVWKVGGAKGKVFAIANHHSVHTHADQPGITFKVSDFAYDILRDAPGLRPAPYLASRGMKWIQHYDEPGLSDDELKAYLAESHRLAAANLTKTRQKELGLYADKR
ncbi:MmcQ/YjbR family DNA-binding protein [Magnetovibrio sp. PR-2]|uniref:MmcQ/YjbR family DNA-binding protein n=1 Tax=Magnetovibrio sp. PR-2 TaxID=3120356 RepID=UPI002FCE0DFB